MKDEKSVQAETVVPFDTEWREKILKQLRDDAAAQLADVRTEKAKGEKRLAVVVGQLAALVATQGLLAAERDKLETELFVLNAEEVRLKNNLGD